jgi:hypothetical protein
MTPPVAVASRRGLVRGGRQTQRQRTPGLAVPCTSDDPCVESDELIYDDVIIAVPDSTSGSLRDAGPATVHHGS